MIELGLSAQPTGTSLVIAGDGRHEAESAASVFWLRPVGFPLWTYVEICHGNGKSVLGFASPHVMHSDIVTPNEKTSAAFFF